MVADTAEDARVDWIEALICERRSIRRFRDEPVSRETLLHILRTALWSPSPHNSQPWRFTVLLAPQDKAHLARKMASQLRTELCADGVEPEIVERQVGRSEERISSAPAVILVSLENDGLVQYPDERRNTLEWQMAVQSVGAALQTLFLLAAAREIGTCWMAAPMYCPNIVRAAVSLPTTYHPQALVLMGYEASPGKVRPRRPVENVVDIR